MRVNRSGKRSPRWIVCMVEDSADFKYSSACFYVRDQIPIIMVDDVQKWL